jgi:hypothetical protein
MSRFISDTLLKMALELCEQDDHAPFPLRPRPRPDSFSGRKTLIGVQHPNHPVNVERANRGKSFVR